MGWKEDNRGAGPWPFAAQPNKWGYLNNPRWVPTPTGPISYDGRESEEPQVWDLEAVANRGGEEHFPCGHWHKPVPPPPTGPPPTGAPNTLETYIELLSAGIIATNSQYEFGVGDTGSIFDVTFNSTYRPLNTADFDGTITYTFEIICRNKSDVNDGDVFLVDENDNVIATINVPAGTHGLIGSSSSGGGTRPTNDDLDWYAFRVIFIPLVGSHSYALRVRIPTNDVNLYGVLQVGRATIKIRQENASMSMVHIPMMTYINGADARYIPLDTGFHYVSIGNELIDSGVSPYDISYAANEAEYYDKYMKSRQIWRFDDTELSTVDRVVFDAAIGFYPPASSSSYVTMFPAFGIMNWVRLGLCWSDYLDNYVDNLSGDFFASPQTNTAGHLYTFIPGSDNIWSLISDGVPSTVRVYIDPSELNAINGKYIHLCYDVDLTGGDGVSHNYDQALPYTNADPLTIPVGESISYAYIDYYAYWNPALSRHEVQATLVYALDDSINDIYIALFDKTTNTMVPGSELHWDTFTPWERKSVTLLASDLTSGHEYIANWKIDNTGGSSYAEVSDINLSLFVTNITAFTSWYMVAKGAIWETAWPAQYRIYDDWRQIISGGIARGTVNIWNRAKVYFPDGSRAWFEVCMYVDTSVIGYDDIKLISFGNSDSGIGIDTDVTDALLSFETSDGDTHRLRSSEIVLTDEHSYGFQSMGYYMSQYMQVRFGFIVIKYI